MVWPEPAHVDALLALMTPRDLAAFAALGADNPAVTIKDGIAASVHAWCALDGDDPLCIGGLIPQTLLGDVGRPWMVSQPGLERHKKALLRESRARLVTLRRHYPVLRNYVACDYPKSLRWLAWLGFTVGEPEQVGSVWVRLVTLT
jgi:hypothetical protein